MEGLDGMEGLGHVVVGFGGDDEIPQHEEAAPPVDNQQPPPYAGVLPPRGSNPNQVSPATPLDRPQPPVYPIPRPPRYPPAGEGAWSNDLFDCFDDVPLFCVTCWCPCIAFGRIAEIVDKGSTPCSTSATIFGLMCAVGVPFIYSCTYRTKIRLQYGIPGDEFGDYCTHLWCQGCSLHQEYKELTARGYDLPVGWHVNMARQKQAQGIQMPPLAPPGMTR